MSVRALWGSARPGHLFKSSAQQAIGILPILVSQTNYCYVIVDEKAKEYVVIDPYNREKIVETLGSTRPLQDATCTRILNTHHHHDHSGANLSLKKYFYGQQPQHAPPIWSGDERSAGVERLLKHGEEVVLTENIAATVLHTPCHTTHHVCYFVYGKETLATTSARGTCTDGSCTDGPCLAGAPASVLPRTDVMQAEAHVFTGDTLFQGGCGRFFEGTAEEMQAALHGQLGRLHPNTLVWNGHEYTAGSVAFAQTVDGENPVVQDAVTVAQAALHGTLPSSVAIELSMNPFMRTSDAALQRAVGVDVAKTWGTAVKTMAALREKKNAM